MQDIGETLLDPVLLELSHKADEFIQKQNIEWEKRTKATTVQPKKPGSKFYILTLYVIDVYLL
jgi:hypothetical protein